MNVNQYFRVKVKKDGLEPETIIALNKMTVKPNESQTIKYNNFIIGLKNAYGISLGVKNLATKLAYLYLLKSHDKEASKICWSESPIGLDPDDADNTLFEVGTPTFITNDGWETNGSNNGLENLRSFGSYPTEGGPYPNTEPLSNMILIVNKKTKTVRGIDCGSGTANNSNLLGTIDSSDKMRGGILTNLTVPARQSAEDAPNGGVGTFYVIKRTPLELEYWYEGSLIDTVTDTFISGRTGTAVGFGFRRGGGTTRGNWSDGKYQLAMAGNIPNNHTIFINAINAYLS